MKCTLQHHLEASRAPARTVASAVLVILTMFFSATSAHAGQIPDAGEPLPVEIDVVVDAVLENHIPEILLPSPGSGRPVKASVGPAFLAAMDESFSRLFTNVRRVSTPSGERLVLELRLTGNPRLQVGRAPAGSGVAGECRFEVEVRLSEPGNRPALFQTIGEGADVFDAEALDEASVREAVQRCATRGAASVTSKLAGWFAAQYAEMRRNARDSLAKTTLRQVASSMEAHFTVGGTYAGANVDSLIASRPPGVELEITRADAEGFEVRARVEGGNAPAWILDSRTAQITPEGELTPPSQVLPPKARIEGALREAATAMEAYYVENNSYSGATAERLADFGYRPPPGISVTVISGEHNFRIEASAPEGSAPLAFDSTTGRIEPIQ